MKSATAAAEPLDEPPGEKPGSCGFVVGPGWRLANSVVTVLPSRMPPAARGNAAALASRGGPAADIDRRAVGRRHVGGVEDVLEAERHPVQQGLFARSVDLARPGQSRLAGEMAPRADHRLALGDPRRGSSATTASAVSSPLSIRRTRLVAGRRCGSAFGMACPRGHSDPLSTHIRGAVPMPEFKHAAAPALRLLGGAASKPIARESEAAAEPQVKGAGGVRVPAGWTGFHPLSPKARLHAWY